MNVVIPQKINNVQVKSIGNYAFGYDCSRGVILPTSALNKYEIKKVSCEIYPIGITSVMLPEGLEQIGDGAFSGNKLKTVTIPKTVTTIYWEAFAGNELQTVIFEGDKNNIYIGCGTFNGDKHSIEVNSLSLPSCK